MFAGICGSGSFRKWKLTGLTMTGRWTTTRNPNVEAIYFYTAHPAQFCVADLCSFWLDVVGLGANWLIEYCENVTFNSGASNESVDISMKIYIMFHERNYN